MCGGGGGIAAEVVADLLHHAADPRVGGAGVEGEHQGAAAVGGNGTNRHAAHDQAAARSQSRQGAGGDKSVHRIGAAVAGDGQGGAVEVVEGGEFLVENLDVVVHHHRGLLVRRHRAAQAAGKVEACIQRTRRGVARQSEIGSADGSAGQHNLAIGL